MTLGKSDILLASHLADILQIHGVHNNFIIIRHKLFVDGMVKWPRLQRGEEWKNEP